jgi:hypothetical protein
MLASEFALASDAESGDPKRHLDGERCLGLAAEKPCADYNTLD